MQGHGKACGNGGRAVSRSPVHAPPDSGRRSWPAWPAPPSSSPTTHAARKRNSPATASRRLDSGPRRTAVWKPHPLWQRPRFPTALDTAGDGLLDHLRAPPVHALSSTRRPAGGRSSLAPLRRAREELCQGTDTPKVGLRPARYPAEPRREAGLFGLRWPDTAFDRFPQPGGPYHRDESGGGRLGLDGSRQAQCGRDQPAR